MGRKGTKGAVSCKDPSPFLWNREVTEERTGSDFILVHYYCYIFYLLFFYSECYNFHQVRSSGFKPLKRVLGLCFSCPSPILLSVILASLSPSPEEMNLFTKGTQCSMS